MAAVLCDRQQDLPPPSTSTKVSAVVSSPGRSLQGLGAARWASALGKAFLSLSQVWLTSMFYLFLLSCAHLPASSSLVGCYWDTGGVGTLPLP